MRWLESANGFLLIIATLLVSLGVIWTRAIRPVWRSATLLADRVQDLEVIRAALTPNSGKSMHDFVGETRRAVERVEAAMAAHCEAESDRWAEVHHRIEQANSRSIRALEILAGAQVREDDRPRTRRDDAGDPAHDSDTTRQQPGPMSADSTR